MPLHSCTLGIGALFKKVCFIFNSNRLKSWEIKKKSQNPHSLVKLAGN